MLDTSPRIVPGKVYLVGGGPGDPDLLTLKGARLLAAADAVVYDNLVGTGVLALARADSERVYVGKKKGDHTLPQVDINRLLIALALQGKMVVRLKGGDPFIFGRGGEEIEALAAAGISCEVVPGVTSASAAAACLETPLTHRDHAQACVFVTGHLKDEHCRPDWPALARPGQTLVFYMGLTCLREIAAALIEHGMPADTPAACVRQVTLPGQAVVRAPLHELPARVEAADIKPPALILIGAVFAPIAPAPFLPDAGD